MYLMDSNLRVYNVKLIVNVIARACDCEEDRIFCILLSIARNLQIVTNHWVSGVCVRMCAILTVLRAHVSFFFFFFLQFFHQK